MPFEDDGQSECGLEPGTIIAGRFQVESKLGEGGMGAVYRATNLATGRWVALKAMHPEYAMKKEVVRRFIREAKAATAIRHPNVIEILDVVEADGGEPVMVMELLEGEPLDELLDRRGPLPLGEVARIMTPVISAVGAAHGLGIIHRDLKPENIYLSRAADGRCLPKVLDFGIAKVLDPNQINELATKSGATRTGSMLGTPHYMSIEQACGEKDIDHRTDIWSLGIILFNMLTGHRPYDGENYGQILRALMTTSPPPIESLAPRLPSDVASMVNRCMARGREDRPQDLREVYGILMRYTDDMTTQVPSLMPAPIPSWNTISGETLQASSVHVSRQGEQVRKRGSRVGLLVVGGVGLMVLAGGIGLAMFWSGDESPAMASSSEMAVQPPPPNAIESTSVVRVVDSAEPLTAAASSSVPKAAAVSTRLPTSATIKPRPTQTSEPSSPGRPTATTTSVGIVDNLPY